MTYAQALAAPKNTTVNCWTTDTAQLSTLSLCGFNHAGQDGRTGLTTMRKDATPGWLVFAPPR